MTIIDIFSKYGWNVPLKDKTGKAISNGLMGIFKNSMSDKLWVDKEEKCYYMYVQKQYFTEN